MTASQFRAAAGQAGLPPEWTERVWAYLDAQTAAAAMPTAGEGAAPAPRTFPIADIFTWLGGLLVLAAVSWAVAVAWDESGPAGALLALTVAMVLMFAVRMFADRQNQQLGSDLLLTGLVAAFALWVLAFFDWTDAWFQPSRDQSRLMDLLTDGIVPMGLLLIALGVLASLGNRFTLLAWPIVLGMVMVLGGSLEALFGRASDHWILLLGGVWFVIGWVLDLVFRRAQAFWFHLAGLLTLLDVFYWDYWEPPRIGLTFLVALICGVVAVLLGRMLYLVAAVIAMHTAIGWAIVELFGGSILAPIALFLVGISVLGVGLKLTLDRGKVEAWMLGWLPPGLVELGARPDR